MTPENFTYDYLIVEFKQEKKMPIAHYVSNAIPPAIGTVLILGELAGFSTPVKFNVVAVELFPGQRDKDIRSVSSYMLVEVQPLYGTHDPTS